MRELVESVARAVRAVIAPGFGDIFFNNCCNNGVLPVVVSEALAGGLRRQLRDDPGALITIDLEAQTFIAPDGTRHGFDVDPHRKFRLLNGLDAVSYTLQFESEMTAFEENYRRATGWLY